MYNLFVSGMHDTWNGDPWTIEIARCVREYTDNNLTKRFGELDEAAVAEVKLYPCIFAYEKALSESPQFGIIRNITKRQGLVRVEYEIQQVDPFLTAEDLIKLSFELDVSDWEMNRTHWAVKDINLPKELHAARCIVLPPMDSSGNKNGRYISSQF